MFAALTSSKSVRSPGQRKSCSREYGTMWHRVLRRQLRNPRDRPWWLRQFILAAEKVRDERQWVRLLRDQLWREDSITRKFDELCPDILELRRLFGMSKFPGPVEDEEWDSIWQCFYEIPYLMVYITVYCKYYEQSTTSPA